MIRQTPAIAHPKNHYYSLTGLIPVKYRLFYTEHAVAGLILFQSVINIGMNLGLMPVTEIPLPFVSYGGSSFLTLMVGIGLVESVAMRHKKLEFD